MNDQITNDLESPEHAALRQGVRAVVTQFDDDYWLTRDYCRPRANREALIARHRKHRPEWKSGRPKRTEQFRSEGATS